jgi:hypothetical protein
MDAAAVVEQPLRRPAGVEKPANGVRGRRALRAVAEQDRIGLRVDLVEAFSVISVWGMARADGSVPLARYFGSRVSTSGSPALRWARTSSSPTVRTLGASSIGVIVPHVASTTNCPGAPSTGRGIMKASSRRGSRSIGAVVFMNMASVASVGEHAANGLDAASMESASAAGENPQRGREHPRGRHRDRHCPHRCARRAPRRWHE